MKNTADLLVYALEKCSNQELDQAAEAITHSQLRLGTLAMLQTRVSEQQRDRAIAEGRR